MQHFKKQTHDEQQYISIQENRKAYWQNISAKRHNNAQHGISISSNPHLFLLLGTLTSGEGASLGVRGEILTILVGVFFCYIPFLFLQAIQSP